MSQLFRVKPLDRLLADADSPERRLKRSLGALQLTALGIGATVGAGIFSSVGTAASGGSAHLGAGPAVTISFLLTAIACGFAALCYAEFASMVPISGSAYTYAYATLGELVAWIIGWDLILEYAVGNVAVAVSWSGYFRQLLRGLGIEWPLWLGVDYRTAAQAAEQAAQAIRAVPSQLMAVYRQAVQAGVSEVLGGQNTRLQAAQHVLDRLVSNGITGYRDAAGRNWSLTSYVEMAVRTGAGQAAVQGHVDALQSAGVDLVKVSDSPRECPKCRPWEGKVLSLSGQVGAVLVPSAIGEGAVRVDVEDTLEGARGAGFQHPN